MSSQNLPPLPRYLRETFGMSFSQNKTNNANENGPKSLHKNKKKRSVSPKPSHEKTKLERQIDLMRNEMVNLYSKCFSSRLHFCGFASHVPNLMNAHLLYFTRTITYEYVIRPQPQRLGPVRLSVIDSVLLYEAEASARFFRNEPYDSYEYLSWRIDVLFESFCQIRPPEMAEFCQNVQKQRVFET